MVFSSSVFLFAFLPLAMAGYFCIPGRKAKNIWLLIVSLFFYAWGEPIYILLMTVSIAMNWILALLMERSMSQSVRQLLLVLACIANVLVIGFFKYEGFLAQNINTLANLDLIPDLELPLPIGISFYTLQALSYVIDVYRGEVKAQRNILFLGMYIACFPQLIAGPIVRYQTIQEQILERKETLDSFASGLRLFIVGLGKKVLLANTVAILANDMLTAGGPAIGFIGAWGGVVAYSFQIFFDFSGYSDMAIGLGRMMGFSYLRNFNYPYISRSITEFWRRWHISLSTFFRDYVYIPLGGSRVSKARWMLNIAVVWAITGLWHGAAWNYILWGVYYGTLLIAEKLFLGKALERMPNLFRHAYVILVFIIGWTFFWITDPSILFPYFRAMTGAYGLTGTNSFWQLGIWEYWPMFIICAIASTPLMPWLKERLMSWAEERAAESVFDVGIAHPRCTQANGLCSFSFDKVIPPRRKLVHTCLIMLDITLLGILLVSMFSIVAGSFNPFIYFQF